MKQSDQVKSRLKVSYGKRQEIIKSLIGMRFNKLTVESFSHFNEKNRLYFNCKCDCGVRKSLLMGNFSGKNASTKSCGCHRADSLRKLAFKHGNTIRGKTPEYNAWQHMISRCYDVNDPRYSNYGGRGITVCKKWRNDFIAFLSDMGNRPTGKSLDRKNNNLGYSKFNCRWADDFQQANNRTTNTRITYKGKSLTLSQWSNETGMNQSTIGWRLKRGWPINRIFEAPVQFNHPK